MSSSRSPRMSKAPQILADDKGHHFSSITIKNFRLFDNVTINSLARINLISGKNNVGKTSLLEAVFLLLGATNISLILKINAFRGVERVEGEIRAINKVLWEQLFHNFNTNNPITISSNLGNGQNISLTLRPIIGKSTPVPLSRSSGSHLDLDTSSVALRTLQLEYKDSRSRRATVELELTPNGLVLPREQLDPAFPGVFSTSRNRAGSTDNITRYGDLERDKVENELLPILKIIEDRLDKISTIVGAGGPLLHGDIGLNKMLPLAMMGDGLGNLFSILLSISSVKGGVVLIDEIENGLHYSVLRSAWKAIGETARKYNVQILATTHSWECIKAAHEAFSKSEEYDFRYHRLQMIKSKIEVISLDKETLENTISSGWEIR